MYIREEERIERASLSPKSDANGFELEAAVMARVGESCLSLGEWSLSLSLFLGLGRMKMGV